MLKKTILFVCHDRSMGKYVSESELSEELGKSELLKAKCLAEYLDSHLDRPVTSVRSSSDARAMRTTALIALAFDKPIVTAENFADRRMPQNLRSLEVSHRAVQAFNDEQRVRWSDSNWRNGVVCALGTPEGEVEEVIHYHGENPTDWIARAHRAVAEIAHLPDGLHIVVTYGQFLDTVMKCMVLGEDLHPKHLLAQQEMIPDMGIVRFTHESSTHSGAERVWRRWYDDAIPHLVGGEPSTR